MNVPHRLARLAAASLALLVSACASKPAAAPAPPPSDEAEEIVQSLTKSFALDAAQQAQTRVFARELIERNTAIHASWERGEKMRPEMLVANRGKFDAEFTAILTPEQRRKYDQERNRLLLKGRSVGPPS
jgi:hypothetical protein